MCKDNSTFVQASQETFFENNILMYENEPNQMDEKMVQNQTHFHGNLNAYGDIGNSHQLTTNIVLFVYTTQQIIL